jgi:nicotinamidase-related amidase
LSPPRALLLTQCVQNDFLRPLAEGESLPSLVHVGRFEAERLCGPAGALAGFLRAAHEVAPEDLAIVHVADAHDPVAHAEHLALFRSHCLAGSPGARLVDPIEELAAARPGTHRIAAGDLNDFEESDLESRLHTLLAGAAVEELRIGVVGVWTDVKVAMLLYDLRTRLDARRLATCSALTASRSIGAHFAALEHLREVLGVEVYDSPGRFLEWLVPSARPAPPAVRGVALSIPEAARRPRGWSEEKIRERDGLVAALSRDADSVRLDPLGGGFSGAQVFLARREGRDPRVLKVGERAEIARERFGNERVARVLGDVVPTLLAWGEGATLGVLEQELAHGGADDAPAPATFQRLDREDESEARTAALSDALERALGTLLGRLYRVAEKDNADLLEVYAFTDRRGRAPFGASVVSKADAVARENGFPGAEALLEEARLPSPWRTPTDFYVGWLPGRSLTREVFPAPVHADLNLANLLASVRPGAERVDRIWVIDFARLTRLPSLTDFAKVENDLAYILVPADDDTALVRLQAMQERRLAGPGLEVKLSDLAGTPRERRHARLVEALRRVAASIDPRGAAALADYRVALLRYAAHTLGFDEPSPRQRRLALTAVARLAGLIAG